MATAGQIDPVKKPGSDSKNLPIVYGLDISESNRGELIQSIHTNKGYSKNKDGINEYGMIPNNQGNFITLKKPWNMGSGLDFYAERPYGKGGKNNDRLFFGRWDGWNLDDAKVTHVKLNENGTVQSMIIKRNDNTLIEIGQNSDGKSIARNVKMENGVFVSRPGTVSMVNSQSLRYYNGEGDNNYAKDIASIMYMTQRTSNKQALNWENNPKGANLGNQYFNNQGIINTDVNQVKIYDPFTVPYENFVQGNVESVNGGAENVSTRKYENDLGKMKGILEKSGFIITGSGVDAMSELMYDIFKDVGPGYMKDGKLNYEMLAEKGIYMNVDQNGNRILTLNLRERSGQTGRTYHDYQVYDKNPFRQVVQFNLDQIQKNGKQSHMGSVIEKFIYNKFIGNSLIQPGQAAVKDENNNWVYQHDITDPFTQQEVKNVNFPYLKSGRGHTAINVTQAIAEEFNIAATEAGSNQRMADSIEQKYKVYEHYDDGIVTYNDAEDADFITIFDYNEGKQKYFPLYNTQKITLPKENDVYQLNPMVINDAQENNEEVITPTDLNDTDKSQEKINNNPEIITKQPELENTTITPPTGPGGTGEPPTPTPTGPTETTTPPPTEPTTPPTGPTPPPPGPPVSEEGGIPTTGPTGTVEVGPPVQSGPVITDDDPQGGGTPSDIPDYTGMNFSNAYDTGRRKDVVEYFMWNGKKYHTKMKKKDGSTESDEEWKANLEKNRQKTRGTRPQEETINLPKIELDKLPEKNKTGLMSPIKSNQNTQNKEALSKGASQGAVNLAGQGAASSVTSVVKKKEQNKNISVVKKNKKKFADTKVGQFFSNISDRLRNRKSNLTTPRQHWKGKW